MNIIGLDIGTTTICGVLYSLKEHKTVRTIQKDNRFLDDRIEYTQDPLVIADTLQSILDELIEASSEKIGSCSISAQMHGILYVDEEGNAVSPFYTWQNKRGRLPAGEGAPALEDYLTGELGYPVHTGYGIVTHCSLILDGSFPEDAQKFCNIGDFAAMRLTGRKVPVTDITLGASMGIADIKTGRHSRSMDRLPLKCREFLPDIVPSTEVLGSYRGIPVVQPIGDNQASFLGSVKEKERSLLLNYGTAGQISFAREEYGQFKGFETRALGDEGYLFAAFSLSGGKSYMILKDFFTQAAILFGSTETGSILKRMDEMDLDFTDSDDDMECMPLFLGERGADRSYGWYKNVTDRNFTPTLMVKATVRGMVNELRRFYLDLPGDVKEDLSFLAAAGNGIRKNSHLIRAAEAEYGMRVNLLDLSEESCLGAAINGGKGAGIFRDYAEGAAEVVRYRIS